MEKNRPVATRRLRVGSAAIMRMPAPGDWIFLLQSAVTSQALAKNSNPNAPSAHVAAISRKLASHPHAAARNGHAIPAMVAPMGVPDCLVEKLKFFRLAGVNWASTTDVTGIMTPYPRPNRPRNRTSAPTLSSATISLNGNSIISFKLFSINVHYILVYYWVLRHPDYLSYGFIFLSGIITDVVFGLPMGVTALTLLIVASVATYVKVVTVRISLMNDWVSFVPALLLASFVYYISLYLSNHSIEYLDLMSKLN